MNFSLPVIVVVTLLLLGYVFMLITVITTPNENDLIMSLKRQNSELLNKMDDKNSNLRGIHNQNIDTTGINHKGSPNAYRPGVIILGMHRSGTSILGGLINKMGLKAGGPLIEAAEDNAKGFFERIDVVLQNDELMKNQGIYYGGSTYKYDTQQGIRDVYTNQIKVKEGERALNFLNDPSSYPWMLKDPRLCITVRSWLPLLNFLPAIVFTYRHPMDVAISLHTRYEHYRLGYALKLWYIYNKKAIQNTYDLCRIVTSHHNGMKQPYEEYEYIYQELLKCGVPVPHQLTKSDVNEFIEIRLQHGKNSLLDNTCQSDINTLLPPNDVWPTTESAHIQLYRDVIKLYCAMEDRSAFLPTFQFNENIHDV